MSGKGCQLLVSPCSVSPSLSMIRGHQSPSIRIPMASPQQAKFSSYSDMGKVKRGAIPSVISEKQSGGHVVLPALSLRRQVLTNGTHQSVSSAEKVSTAIQTGRCFKGKTTTKPINPRRYEHNLGVTIISETFYWCFSVWPAGNWIHLKRHRWHIL